MASIDIITVVDDAPQLLSTTTGSGQPRLFEGDGLYIYSIANQLLISSDGALTFTNIMPTEQSFISAICQTSRPQGAGIEAIYNYITIVTAQTTVSGAPRTKVLRAYTPEEPDTWVADATLATDFLASDMLVHEVNVGAILIGNSRSTSTTKILRNTATGPPFSTWTESDSGLPQSGTASRITDLDSPGN